MIELLQPLEIDALVETDPLRLRDYAHHVSRTVLHQAELLAEADRDLTQVIFERDRCAEVADSLAESIAEMTGVEIGEHSSENDPWLNAIAAAASGTFDRTRPGTPAAHDYVSTACQHDLHARCRRVCKFCDVACRCGCGHPGEGAPCEPSTADQADDELSTPELGHVTPQMLAAIAFVESIRNRNIDLPLDDDAEGELADINARVAADKRVLDAAEALHDGFTTMRDIGTVLTEFHDAVTARRALTGEPAAVPLVTDWDMPAQVVQLQCLENVERCATEGCTNAKTGWGVCDPVEAAS